MGKLKIKEECDFCDNKPEWYIKALVGNQTCGFERNTHIKIFLCDEHLQEKIISFRYYFDYVIITNINKET